MELKPGYKQTEVGVIPEDWQITTLAKVCQMKSGENITSASIDQFSAYPCYGGNGLRGFTNRFTHIGNYALIGRQGAHCGNVLGVEGKFFASEHAVVVTASSKSDIQWLTFLLGEMNLNQYSESSAQPGLSVSKILSLDVALPPTLAEQQAIAEALSDTDALIESLEQLIAKKRQIKQGAMQELLSPQDNWSEKFIIEITDCLDNLRIPLNDTQRAEMSGDFPYCGANGILDFINDYRVDDTVILIAEDGGHFEDFINRPIAYRMSGKFWVNNHAHILKAKPIYDQDFIFYSLVHKNILSFISSGTRAKLNRSELNKITVQLPANKSEQTTIATILNDIDNEIVELEEQLSKTRMLKQGMMQELLTGRIRLI